MQMHSPSPIELYYRAKISDVEARRSALFDKRAYAERVASKLGSWLQDVERQMKGLAAGCGAVAESIAIMLQTSTTQKEERIKELDEQCDRLWHHRKRLEYLLEEYRENPPDPQNN